MTRSRTRGASVVAALIASAIVVGIARGATSTHSDAKASDAKAGGNLTVATVIDFTNNTFDPIKSAGGATFIINPLVYDTLTTLDDNMKVAPGIATSWKQISPKVWVFNIRKGVRFSNGRELTPDDVIGSIMRFYGPGVTFTTLPTGLGPIRSLVKSGPSQIKFTLRTPNHIVPVVLTDPSSVILPMKELNAGTFDVTTQLLGTGPFVVTSHVPGESWTFVKNKYYWRKGLPKASSLTVKVITDETARMAALRAGSIGMTWFDGTNTPALLRGTPNVKTAIEDLTTIETVHLNAVSSIFTDARLRQAVALAINRKQIADLAMNGVGKPTAASPAAFGVCDAATMPYAKPDLTRARALVQAAGAAGKKVTILAPNYGGEFVRIAQVVQQQLNSIGLNSTVLPVDTATYINAIRPTATFDLFVGRYAGLADPTALLTHWNPNVSTFNQTYVPEDVTLNRLILRAKLAPLGKKRDKAIVAACKRIATGAVIIPTITKGLVIGWRTDQMSVRMPKTEGWSNFIRDIAYFVPKG